MSESVIHLLHNAGQAADKAFEKAVGVAGITPRQCAVLIAIRDAKEPPSQTHLVSATGVDRSTMTGIVRRLVTRKLVSRKRKRKDARAYAVELTEQGHVVADAVEEAAKETSRMLVRQLPRDVRVPFTNALRALAELSAMPAIAKPLEAAE